MPVHDRRKSTVTKAATPTNSTNIARGMMGVLPGFPESPASSQKSSLHMDHEFAVLGNSDRKADNERLTASAWRGSERGYDPQSRLQRVDGIILHDGKAEFKGHGESLAELASNRGVEWEE